jgi:glycosyltransferase involved in cell wall biosynthesis
MPENPRVLFLYTELAGYTLACLNALASAGAEVHVVRRPVNKEAPFIFDGGGKVLFYERSQLSRTSLLELTEEIQPSLIVVSGWIDKDYLYIARKLRKRGQLVLAFDNQWTASLRQRIAGLVARCSFVRNFDHVWVPGQRQAEFARKLGFKAEQIHYGFYSCDSNLYNAYFESGKAGKEKCFPKRFVFVGRYYEFKGIQDLWDAFAALQKEKERGWELWCLGTGDITPMQFPGIRHFGFVQPDQMEQIIKESGVFIMPSHFEPWGVAVHEFAAAGFPLLCSDKVGAADAFLNLGINGYIYEAGDVEGLKNNMRKFTVMPDNQLLEMGRLSHVLSKSISPDSWAQEALSLSRKSSTANNGNQKY